MSTELNPPDESGRHPINVGHLVMGIAFLGLVGVWAAIEADVIGDGDIRWLVPVPWVLAGLAGLLAIGLGGRRKQAADHGAPSPHHEAYAAPYPAPHDDTTVIPTDTNQEQDR